MPSMTQCSNCKDTVGNEVKVSGFHERDGSKLLDTWCPQCFCYHRVILEPEKYQPLAYIPIACNRCGWSMIDHGPQGQCGRCGSRAVRALGPKPQTRTALQEVIESSLDK